MHSTEPLGPFRKNTSQNCFIRIEKKETLQTTTTMMSARAQSRKRKNPDGLVEDPEDENDVKEEDDVSITRGKKRLRLSDLFSDVLHVSECKLNQDDWNVALVQAIRMGDLSSMIFFLQDRGADITFQNFYPIRLALQLGKSEAIRCLVECLFGRLAKEPLQMLPILTRILDLNAPQQVIQVVLRSMLDGWDSTLSPSSILYGHAYTSLFSVLIQHHDRWMWIPWIWTHRPILRTKLLSSDKRMLKCLLLQLLEHGTTECIHLLFGALDQDPELALYPMDYDELMVDACKFKQFHAARWLLSQRSKDMDLTHEQYAAIRELVYHNELDVLKLFLDKGRVDVSFDEYWMWTYGVKLSNGNDVRLLRLLLECHPGPRPSIEKFRGHCSTQVQRLLCQSKRILQQSIWEVVVSKLSTNDLSLPLSRLEVGLQLFPRSFLLHTLRPSLQRFSLPLSLSSEWKQQLSQTVHAFCLPPALMTTTTTTHPIVDKIGHCVTQDAYAYIQEVLACICSDHHYPDHTDHTENMTDIHVEPSVLPLDIACTIILGEYVIGCSFD